MVPSPIFAGRRPVFAKKGWAVEVDDVTSLAKNEGGRHRQARAHHVADHYAKAVPARFVGDQQSFGEASTLVELDVDDVEAAKQARHVVEAERALVGCDRDRAAVAVEIGLMSPRPVAARGARRDAG